MPSRLAVIIPTLDEERMIASAVRSAREAGAARVIVSDGGSDDATRTVAAEAGAEVLSLATTRAMQCNRAAAAAGDCDIFCFLHADTMLPASGGDSIRRAVGSGYRHGAFRISFRERRPMLRVAASMINLRCRITRTAWGDQAPFFTKSLFEELGGFPELPIMEDYEISLRARKLDRGILLSDRVITSARRFDRHGVLRTAWINWRTVAAYHAGTDPGELARRYRAR